MLPGCAVWLLCQLAMDPGRSEEKGAPSQAVLPLAAARRKKLHFCGAASLGLARGSQAGSAQAHCPSCPKLTSPWPPTCLWPHSSPVPEASMAQRGEGSQHRHEGSAWAVCTDHRLQTFQVPDSLQILPPCTLPHARPRLLHRSLCGVTLGLLGLAECTPGVPSAPSIREAGSLAPDTSTASVDGQASLHVEA